MAEASKRPETLSKAMRGEEEAEEKRNDRKKEVLEKRRSETISSKTTAPAACISRPSLAT